MFFNIFKRSVYDDVDVLLLFLRRFFFDERYLYLVRP